MRSVHNAIEYGARKLRYQELKFEQTKDKSSMHIWPAEMCLLVSPIGSGKSLSFHIAPFVFDFMRHGEREESSSACLVIAPLLSLMRDQLAKLRDMGIAAGCLGSDSWTEEIQAIASGKMLLVF